MLEPSLLSKHDSDQIDHTLTISRRQGRDEAGESPDIESDGHYHGQCGREKLNYTDASQTGPARALHLFK